MTQVAQRSDQLFITHTHTESERERETITKTLLSKLSGETQGP